MCDSLDLFFLLTFDCISFCLKIPRLRLVKFYTRLFLHDTYAHSLLALLCPDFFKDNKVNYLAQRSSLSYLYIVAYIDFVCQIIRKSCVQSCFLFVESLVFWHKYLSLKFYNNSLWKLLCHKAFKSSSSCCSLSLIFLS